MLFMPAHTKALQVKNAMTNQICALDISRLTGMVTLVGGLFEASLRGNLLSTISTTSEKKHSRLYTNAPLVDIC